VTGSRGPYREGVARPGFGDAATESMSVRSVNHERWLEAQAWEREFWVSAERRRGWRRVAWPLLRPVLRRVGWYRAWGDDWNHWWADQFHGYAFLPPDLGDYIEVGCGPYTNTRVILSARTASRVVCSDPLIETYLNFRDRWLATVHRSGQVETDAHPIEELPFEPESFDTLVMINVLDHVRDADRCLEVVTGLVRPGGTLILGQDLSDAEDVRRHPDDVGHPIRLTRADVDRHLGDFEPVVNKNLPRNAGRDPRLHYGTLVYAGVKSARER
jgi:SAM-dependent methyltransferase